MTNEKDHGASLAEGQPLASPSMSDAATARHTPGPWRVDEENDRFEVIGGDGRDLTMIRSSYREVGEQRANAHLIAAAPEMKELLYQYRDDMRHPVTNADSRARRVERIEALIAKAEGRA